uniref:general transcription factor 3C polypeptide 2 isoform X2 n=1 Tax=Myxine glutinosa TaxID=7769 RepID=UPI0035900463
MKDSEDRETAATYGPKSQGCGSENLLGDEGVGQPHLGNFRRPAGEGKETQNPSNSLSHSAIINLKEPDHSYHCEPKRIHSQNKNSRSSGKTILASPREEPAGRPVRPLQASEVQGSRGKCENLDTKADSFPESQNTPTTSSITALQKKAAQEISSTNEGTGFVPPEFRNNDCELSDGVSPGNPNVDLNVLSHGVAYRRGERALCLRPGRSRGRGRVKVRTGGRGSCSSFGGLEDHSKLESSDIKDKSSGTTEERTPKRKAAQKANKFLQEVASFLNQKVNTRVEKPSRASHPKIATPVSKSIEETDSHSEAPFGGLDSAGSSLGKDAAAAVEHGVRDCSDVSRTPGSQDRKQHSAHCVAYNPDNRRTHRRTHLGLTFQDNMEEAVGETPCILPGESPDDKRQQIFQDDPKIFSQNVSQSEDCSLSIMTKVSRPRGRACGRRRRRRGQMLGRSGSCLGRGSNDGPTVPGGNVSEHCSRPHRALRRYRQRRCKWTWEVHKEADVLNTPQDQLQGEGTIENRPKRKAATKAALFLQNFASSCPEEKVDQKLDDHPYILEEKTKVRSSKTYGLTAILDCLNEAAQATHSQRQMNQSVELFPKWIPYQHDWKFLGEREAKPYLPEERVSPLFEIHRENSKKHTPPQRLSRFGAVPVTEYEKDLTFFVGGPVWSLEWCPTPDGVAAVQFASVYCTRSWRSTHTLDECHVEPSLLQLWILGALQNTCCSDQEPSLAYGLALDYGCIWDMKWCPSGAWQVASSSSQEGQMSRLGLLAAGFSDGKIRIFFLPHPDSLPLASSNPSEVAPVEPRIFKVKRFVTLEVGAIFNKEDASCGQCFSLDWMPHKGHTHLAAGFYDGSVAIWELTSSSCLLRTGTIDSCTIFPYQLFIAHNRVVSSIVWSPTNRYFLATSSHDRYIKFWDIRRVPDPVSVSQRYKSTEIAWPLQYCGTIAAQECFSKRFLQNGMLYADFGFLGFKPHLVPAESSSVWTVSVCNWTNILYMGDGAGSVVGTMLPNCWKEQSLYQHYIFPVYWMEKRDASGQEETDKTEKCSSIWQVHVGKKGQEGGEKPSEFGLTFHDTDLSSFFKHRARDSFKRLSDKRKYMSSQLDDALLKPHFAIHKVRSNPCLDSHLWLLSAGFSGLVRAHCVHALLSNSASSLTNKSQYLFHNQGS